MLFLVSAWSLCTPLPEVSVENDGMLDRQLRFKLSSFQLLDPLARPDVQSHGLERRFGTTRRIRICFSLHRLHSYPLYKNALDA